MRLGSCCTAQSVRDLGSLHTVINIRLHLLLRPRQVNGMAEDKHFEDIFNFEIVDPRDSSQVQDADAVYRVNASSLPNSAEPSVTPNEASND